MSYKIRQKENILKRKKMINLNNLKNLAFEFLISKKTKMGKYRADFNYSKHNNTLKIIFNSSDDNLFEKLILADKTEIKKYISLYRAYLKANGHSFKSIEKLQKEKKNKKVFKALLALHNTYENFFKVWNNKIVDALDTRTCLYCNREYIINYTDQTKTKTTAELDHFYPRSLYPFLSITFLNLIPSCKTCNSKLKGDKDTFVEEILYPYQESLNDNANFKLKILDTDFLHNKGKFVLNLDVKNKKAKESKKLFKLQELYNEHKDIVLELIQKAEIYNDSYIDELMQKYEGTLFKNREDLLRLITCGYINDEDLHKRPLSKLIKDISEELQLL
jgi:5-methylcytosine-specific restriction endonuclease McrA